MGIISLYVSMFQLLSAGQVSTVDAPRVGLPYVEVRVLNLSTKNLWILEFPPFWDVEVLSDNGARFSSREEHKRDQYGNPAERDWKVIRPGRTYLYRIPTGLKGPQWAASKAKISVRMKLHQLSYYWRETAPLEARSNGKPLAIAGTLQATRGPGG